MKHQRFTVYTRPGCQYCTLAKEALSLVGAVVDEVDADSSMYYNDTYVSKGIRQVPKIWLDGDTEIGGYGDLVDYLLDNEETP